MTADTAAAWSALARVRDPELDEPITDLGFVRELSVAGGRVRAELRLPTYFCAPNFVYMMVADADAELRSLPGVTEVEVGVGGHFAAGEINDGVRRETGFAGAFPGLADGDLAELRLVFRRKAFLAALGRVCRDLGDRDPGALAGTRLADVPESPLKDAYRRARADIGLPAGPDSLVVTDPEGRPVPAERLARHLRFADTVRVSVEGNAEHCRALLAARYAEDRPGGDHAPPSGTYGAYPAGRASGGHPSRAVAGARHAGERDRQQEVCHEGRTSARI